MRRTCMAMGLALLLLGCGGGRRPAVRAAALPKEVGQVAQDYVKALAMGDSKVLRELTPTSLALRYGPCPFAEMPKLGKAKVDAHRAAIEFTGKTTSRDLPPKGAIMLTLVEDGKVRWQLRDIFFYEQLPAGVKLPTRSVTRKDAAQEKEVLQSAETYVRAWLAKDYETMARYNFDWIGYRSSRPPRWKFGGAKLNGREIRPGEYNVKVVATVVVLRIIPREFEGTVRVLKEDGCWKVRKGSGLAF